MFKWIIGLIPKFIKTWFTNLLYKDIAKEGINGDTELAYLTPYEQSLLLSLGGAGTYNKKTNLKQYWGPLAIGLAVGTAAFGIAKLSGASTKKALMIGGLAGLGVGGISALTATKAGTLVGSTAAQAGMAGGTVPATALSKIAASTNPFIAGSTTGGTLGNIAAGAGGMAGTGGAILGPAGGAFVPIAQGGSGLSMPLGTSNMFQNVGGKIIKPDVIPNVPSASGGALDVGGGIKSFGTKALDYIEENPLSTIGGGATLLSLASQQKPVYDTGIDQLEFADMEGEIYRREREKTQPMSDRFVYDDEELPENIYDRPDFQPVMVAREGGLATLKLKEGGINYLPSKLEHNEKDSNNYVRAKGYVEDGSGVGDKDEDTMLAQLADGEFVSRADAILGAGIMEGANPEDFKDMRKKGAQFFYGQQDKLKRIYDIVSDANKES
jgi:hypothetical protein